MQPGPQFHGAREGWVDTHVRPPSVTGAPAISSSGYSSGSHRPPHKEMAFATDSEHVAWSYARVVPHDPDHPVNNDPDPKWRSRVHVVGRAPDQYQENPGDEIESQVGFPILRTHMHAPGETGTFPEINWNAFKARGPGPHHLVSPRDMNHSYMQDQGPPRPPATPRPYDETKSEHDNRYNAPDARHPDQLNLFTGHTVTEHRRYENTPGVSIHLSPEQFPEHAAMQADPSVKTIRQAKDYHRVDVELGTVK